MKAATTSAAIVGTVVGIALGVWIGVEMTSARDTVTTQAALVQPADASAVAPAAVAPTRAARVARVTPKKAANADEAAESAPKLVLTIPVTAPELHDRIRPVLARGTKIPMAVEGFRDAEQFATIAHAARNTNVPFILLKHRVLTQGQSLAEAIRASKPDLDALMEVERARSEAKSDIAALSRGSAAGE